jgi:prolyl 4-hydroxylase
MARRNTREIQLLDNNIKFCFWIFLFLLVPSTLSVEEGEESSTNELATVKLWALLDEHDSALEMEKFSALTEFGVYGTFSQSTCTDTNLKECKDLLETCEALAGRGECRFHYNQCPKACLICQTSERFEIGEKQGIPAHIYQEVQQTAEELNITNLEIDKSIDRLISKTASVIRKTQEYMALIVMQDPRYQRVRRSCQNYDIFCSAYAAIGYCRDDFLQGTDYTYMMTYCAPACQKCDDYELLQPCSANQYFNIFEEGDLDRMFTQMVGEDEVGSLPYKPTVHSRPGARGARGDDVIDGPWIVSLMNFLTDDECNQLIALGREQGYGLSSMLEEDAEEYRTSVNSWCTRECAEDPVAKAVIERISQTTRIPPDYSEPLQMLQYMPGQRYKEHHDVDHDSFDHAHGPRLLTFLLYLNDVKEGGATRMIDLNYEGDADEDGEKSYLPVPLEILPRKGMALVWANLNDEDLMIKEERTWHEALPVIRGIKYGANAWIRIRRFADDCNTTALEEWKLEHNLLAKFD